MTESTKRFIKALVRIWPWRVFYRIHIFSSFFLLKIGQGLSWSSKRTEDSNFYYDLSSKNIHELENFVSLITGTELSTIQGYIEEIRQDSELMNHITSILNKDLSMKDSSMLLGRRLGWYAFVRAKKPRIVVETGVHQGVGAVTLIRGLQANAREGFPGKYFGTDIDPKAGALVVGEYAETGKIMFGDSITSLKNFSETIDIFVNDSDHSARYEAEEYLIIHEKLASESLILSDNSHASDSLLQYARQNTLEFLLFHEEPAGHWYPGGGIGVAFSKTSK